MGEATDVTSAPAAGPTRETFPGLRGSDGTFATRPTPVILRDLAAATTPTGGGPDLKSEIPAQGIART